MLRLSKRMFITLSFAKAFSTEQTQATLFYRPINKYLQQYTNTVKEPESTKSHALTIIHKSNFTLSIAGMWALCQAILTEELLFCTDQE